MLAPIPVISRPQALGVSCGNNHVLCRQKCKENNKLNINLWGTIEWFYNIIGVYAI